MRNYSTCSRFAMQSAAQIAGSRRSHTAATVIFCANSDPSIRLVQSHELSSPHPTGLVWRGRVNPACDPRRELWNNDDEFRRADRVGGGQMSVRRVSDGYVVA